MTNTTDTNQASKVKRNSLNKSDIDVKLEPMSKNTTDELRHDVEFRLQMADIDVVPVQAINTIIDLITTAQNSILDEAIADKANSLTWMRDDGTEEVYVKVSTLEALKKKGLYERKAISTRAACTDARQN